MSTAPVYTRNIEAGDRISPASYTDTDTSWPVKVTRVEPAGYDPGFGYWVKGTDSRGCAYRELAKSSDEWHLAPAPFTGQSLSQSLVRGLSGQPFDFDPAATIAAMAHDDPMWSLPGIYARCALASGTWLSWAHVVAYRLYLLLAAAREMTRDQAGPERRAQPLSQPA